MRGWSQTECCLGGWGYAQEVHREGACADYRCPPRQLRDLGLVIEIRVTPHKGRANSFTMLKNFGSLHLLLGIF